jgi:hypothetical protein
MDLHKNGFQRFQVLQEALLQGLDKSLVACLANYSLPEAMCQWALDDLWDGVGLNTNRVKDRQGRGSF